MENWKNKMWRNWGTPSRDTHVVQTEQPTQNWTNHNDQPPEEDKKWGIQSFTMGNYFMFIIPQNNIKSSMILSIFID